ncbi:MAG: ATP-binding protein [Myxococcota bacterium]
MLEGLEAIRRRPGMYIGDVRDGSGLHHLLWEAVGNGIDLHLRRQAAHLKVWVAGSEITVEDDGPGFPLRKDGLPVFAEALELIHGSATLYDDHRPRVHIGPAIFGVGLAVVNALSSRLLVETRTEGRGFRQRYAQGVRVGPLEHLGPAAKTGTRIQFTPDPTIFGDGQVSPVRIETRLRELAYLNPGLTIRTQDTTLRARDGLRGWLRARMPADATAPICCFSARHSNHVWVEVALTWVDDSSPADVQSFVSQFATYDHGAHLLGLWEGIVRALRDTSQGPSIPKRLRESVRDECLRPGLIAVVHAGLYDPRFGSPTRDRLMSPEARVAVRELTTGHLTSFFLRNPVLRRQLVTRFQHAGAAS